MEKKPSKAKKNEQVGNPRELAQLKEKLGGLLKKPIGDAGGFGIW